MFGFLKYLPLLAKLQDARKAYTETEGKDNPFLSRKLIGAVVALGGAFLAIQFGVTLDADFLNNLTNSIETIGTAGVALYGAIMFLVSALKKKEVK